MNDITTNQNQAPLYFTKRELQIMMTLWKSSEPLSSYEIYERTDDMSKNTIQQMLRKMHEEGFIRISGMGFTKNALTRKYEASFSEEDYFIRMLSADGVPAMATKCISEIKNRAQLSHLKDLINTRLQTLA